MSIPILAEIQVLASTNNHGSQPEDFEIKADLGVNSLSNILKALKSKVFSFFTGTFNKISKWYGSAKSEVEKLAEDGSSHFFLPSCVYL